MIFKRGIVSKIPLIKKYTFDRSSPGKRKVEILYKNIHTYKKLNKEVCHMQRGE